MVLLVPKAPWDQRDPPVLLVPKALRDRLVLMGYKDPMELLV